MSKQNQKSETVSAREAAALLGISYPTFMRRVRSGEIKSVTVPNPLLKKQRGLEFRRTDIEKLLKPS